MYIREATWQNIGTNVSTSNNILDALKNADLDFSVSKQPLFTKLNSQEFVVPNKLATVREDTGEVLGIVGADYTVCQNADAFAFIDYVSKDLTFEKAGRTRSGMMYVIAKLPDVTILGDTFTPHLIFQNGFNGNYPVRAAICPLRVVCQNQLAISFRNTPNAISIRHNATLTDRLDAAKQTFLETTEYMKELDAQANKLAMKPFTTAEFQNFIDTQFEIKSDMTDLQKQRIEAVRSRIWEAYNASDNSNFRGTAWGAVNAMSDYFTHRVPSRKSDKFADNQFIAVTFNPVILQTIYERAAA